ncbi:MAG: SAVED domain-containing protein [Sedimentisphaerales bacterium]
MAKEVTRYIKHEVERELWARAAGRCQFSGCNRLLYKSPVTQDRVNISEKAHIYSFSEKGPRGRGPFKKKLKALNNVSNLMLVCHDCHKTIDEDADGRKYSALLLLEWKKQHEQRIELVTGISPDKKSYVVMYGANIGDEKSLVQYNPAVEAMFPERYPTKDSPIELSMNWQNEDSKPDYWDTEKSNLERNFQKQIRPIIEKDNLAHFSLFAFAPQPLLIRLGALFTDKICVEVYQPIREPKTWRWQEHPDNFEFIVKEPDNFDKQPVLVFSLSGKITEGRIIPVIGRNISIWEITVGKSFLHNDFMRSQAQLTMFRQAVRKVIVSIKEKHGQSTPLHIFPAMPVSCAIEMGRVRMPKADMPWIIYDQNNKLGGFIPAIEVKN